MAVKGVYENPKSLFYYRVNWDDVNVYSGWVAQFILIFSSP